MQTDQKASRLCSEWVCANMKNSCHHSHCLSKGTEVKAGRHDPETLHVRSGGWWPGSWGGCWGASTEGCVTGQARGSTEHKCGWEWRRGCRGDNEWSLWGVSLQGGIKHQRRSCPGRKGSQEQWILFYHTTQSCHTVHIFRASMGQCRDTCSGENSPEAAGPVPLTRAAAMAPPWRRWGHCTQVHPHTASFTTRDFRASPATKLMAEGWLCAEPMEGTAWRPSWRQPRGQGWKSQKADHLRSRRQQTLMPHEQVSPGRKL